MFSAGLRKLHNTQSGLGAVTKEMVDLSINAPGFTIGDSLMDFDHDMASSNTQQTVLAHKSNRRGAGKQVKGARVTAAVDTTKTKSTNQKRRELSRQLLDERKAMVKIRSEVEEMEQARNQAGPVSMLAPSVLIHLVGPDVKDCEPMVLMYRILTTIEAQIGMAPDMILRGRTTDLFRIDYSPTRDDVVGIKSRLEKLVSPEIDYADIEALLSPLVFMNPKTFAWSREGVITSQQLQDSTVHSSWSWGLKGIRKVRPVTWMKRVDVVAGILEAVRSRCFKVEPDSKLLFDPDRLEDWMDEDDNQHFREWSLHGDDRGLATKLMACFADSGRSTAEYEDLIERTLLCYNIANQTAIFGKQRKIDRLLAKHKKRDRSVTKVLVKEEEQEEEEEEDGGVRL